MEGVESALAELPTTPLALMGALETTQKLLATVLALSVGQAECEKMLQGLERALDEMPHDEVARGARIAIRNYRALIEQLAP